MPFKTIMIKKSVYDRIKLRKRKGESFSDLFAREFGDDHSRFFGCLKLSEGERKAVRARMRVFRVGFEQDVGRRHVLSRLRRTD